MRQYNKAKGPTKTNSRIFIRAKFNFWRETRIFLLFKLHRQLKRHSSFIKINTRKNSKKPSFTKINPREKILKRDCLRFERLKNAGLNHDIKFDKIVEVPNWIYSNNKYVHSTECPNGVFYWRKYDDMKWRRKVLKEKQTGGRFYSSLLSLAYRYRRWRLVQMKIRFHRFPNIIALTIFRFPSETEFLGPHLRPTLLIGCG